MRWNLTSRIVEAVKPAAAAITDLGPALDRMAGSLKSVLYISVVALATATLALLFAVRGRNVRAAV